ncbi:MarC family protein [Desulfohalovibrio reitneri]|uniref:MarC family protein n=1 Tax=Desulfohalovibrio reitneri TaxID=1307759 RepID=UPI0004A76CDE|nr:MarC family protein [Desulfohalovibrio reitneri]
MFLSVCITFFFLLTPFFVLTVFLSLTADENAAARRRLAVRTTLAVLVVTFVLYFFGQAIFDIFGITLDAFRIGAGSLLFLSAVNLVGSAKAPAAGEGDVSVVPLAIPVAVGPATTGAILVMGAEGADPSERLVGLAALGTAVLALGALLYLSSPVERLLGKQGLSILTKLTGLVLAALSAQIVFTGIKNFLDL